jgi:hypothetical protein
MENTANNECQLSAIELVLNRPICTMKNKSLFLSIIFFCLIAVSVRSSVVEAGLPSVSPPSGDEGYTDVSIDKVISPTISAQIAKKWIRFKATYSMAVPDMTDLPKEYEDGWVRISVIDPNDILSSTVNVVIPKAKSDIVSELKYGDVIEVFAYGEPIKTTVFERTVNRILFIVDKIRKVK